RRREVRLPRAPGAPEDEAQAVRAPQLRVAGAILQRARVGGPERFRARLEVAQGAMAMDEGDRLEGIGGMGRGPAARAGAAPDVLAAADGLVHEADAAAASTGGAPSGGTGGVGGLGACHCSSRWFEACSATWRRSRPSRRTTVQASSSRERR